MSTTIVAISGKITSGKSTLANAICAADPRFVRLSLADEMKNDIANLCEVDRAYIEANKDLFRPIMQYYGTDIMRHVHGQDYWVDRLVDKIYDECLKFVVVDDVRFPNELLGLQNAAHRFLSVRIHIDDAEQERRCIEKFGEKLSFAKLNHPSETALDGWTTRFHINLNATDLTEAQVRRVLALIPPAYAPQEQRV